MALTRFPDADLTALRWLRVGTSPDAFTLSSGDRPIAELRWAHTSGSLAHAETESAHWTVKRAGFLNPHVLLRAAGSDAEVARISVRLGYHALEVAGGARYRFHRAGERTGARVPAWQVTTESADELVHIEPVREGRELAAGAVLVAPAARGAEDLPALLVMTWYFVALSWFEDEALIPFEGSG